MKRQRDWRAVMLGAGVAAIVAPAFAVLADVLIDVPSDPDEGPTQVLGKGFLVLLTGAVGFTIGSAVAAAASRYGRSIGDAIIATAVGYAPMLPLLLAVLDDTRWWDIWLLLLFPGSLVLLAGVVGAVIGLLVVRRYKASGGSAAATPS